MKFFFRSPNTTAIIHRVTVQEAKNEKGQRLGGNSAPFNFSEKTQMLKAYTGIFSARALKWVGGHARLWNMGLARTMIFMFSRNVV